MRKVGDGEWCDGLACGAWRERYGHVATRHYYFENNGENAAFFYIHIYF